MSRRKPHEVRRAKAARRTRRVAAQRARRPQGPRRWHWDPDGLITLAFAFAVLAFGLWVGRDTYYLQQRGEIVPATVLSIGSGKSPEIEVRYVTKAGQTVEDGTRNYDEAATGGTIDVIYDPQDPKRMQAADYGFDYVLPGLTGALGIGLLVYATTQFYRRGRHS
ncbi:DUF3592 domain-containing protein [Kribbella sp. NPDC051770]|uniref:DUF3592 domain-containing protein n=1 Tax=Kribbella sp. NPDC051770 TaxID=3155413 RepID=UPI00342ED473